ncbi:glycosyltransferase [Enterococcus raffinosus]|uniref:glycosyltransferase n=1 Tax=Enterococcus raffinosus TaxID=71452 RepID=UPI001C0F9EAF|nr:glycosyltransferase [Enterococcus raffinosus]MBU5363116.1 glycosyltransferase [Enterococcus raffinosus]
MFEVVVVLYNMTFSESPTVVSLNKLLSSGAFPEIRKILIFDNSESSTIPEGLDKRFVYYHSKTNVGLAKAYNYTLSQSFDDTEWLVTMDQDTLITADYLTEIVKHHDISSDIVLLAPLVKDQNQQISPVFGDNLRPLHKDLPKKNQSYSQMVMVINSGATIRVSFMREIGGYNLDFPLDYLDHWLCWKVFKEQKKIFILNVTLQHELSVLNYVDQMNISRYKSIMHAEAIYYSSYAGDLFIAYRKQLFFRGCKQILTGKFNYGKLTFIYFFHNSFK